MIFGATNRASQASATQRPAPIAGPFIAATKDVFKDIDKREGLASMIDTKTR